MNNENPETAKIFLNLEDSPETSAAMSTDTDGGFEQDQPVMPMRPQAINKSSSVASGPALVALIVLLGGGSIFGMRVVSGQAAIDKDKFELDYTESVIGSDFDARFETTMINLERSTRPVQVPIGYIQRDPFQFYDGGILQPVVIDENTGPTMTPEERERIRLEKEARREADRRKKIELTAMVKTVEGYELQSTLMGTNPVARVSGEIVRLGGTLNYTVDYGEDETSNAFFTVESIGGRMVVLVGPEGSRYELSIGMPIRQLERAEMPEEDAPEAEPVVDEFAIAAQRVLMESDTEESSTAEDDSQEASETDDAPASEEPVTEESDPSTDSEQAASEDEAPVEMSFIEKLRAASEAVKQTETDQAESDETESDEAKVDDADEPGTDAAEGDPVVTDESESDAVETDEVVSDDAESGVDSEEEDASGEEGGEETADSDSDSDSETESESEPVSESETDEGSDEGTPTDEGEGSDPADEGGR